MSISLGLNKNMGITCSCRAGNDHVKSVHSVATVNTTRRATSENGLIGESGIRRLDLFYGEEIQLLPKKLRYYYDKIMAGGHEEVKEVVLRLVKLGENELKCLCRLLPFYVHVTGLTLWKVGLDIETVRELTESLVLIKGLQTLGIEGNDLKDECLLCMSRSFKLLTSLRELWLSSNQFTAVGAIVLANSLQDLPSLSVLNLDDNFLGSEGCRALCRALVPRTRLRVVSLKGNGIGPEAIDELVALGSSNPPVETLNLDANCLTDANCSTLSALYGPEVIHLSKQSPS